MEKRGGTNVKTVYAQGSYAAARQYGLEKQAVLSGLLRGLRTHLIGPAGNHAKVLQQANAGTLWSPGGLWREGLLPPSGFPKYLTLGLNGLAAYQALQAPEEERGSAVGGLAGSLLGGAMGYPYGILGSLAGSTLGHLGGSSIGSLANKKKEKEPDYLYSL